MISLVLLSVPLSLRRLHDPVEVALSWAREVSEYKAARNVFF